MLTINHPEPGGSKALIYPYGSKNHIEKQLRPARQDVAKGKMIG